MKSLFAGLPAESLIFPYPEPSRGELDEVNSYLDAIRRFAAKSIDPAAIDESGEIPREVLEGLAGLGIFGLAVPKAYGGAGLTTTAYARIVQEIAGIDGAVAHAVMAHQSLGLAALLFFGSEDLKTKIVPRCARGEAFAAFALTELGAGSDAGGVQTRADLDPSGDHYVLRGE